jgi:hypothetical protein
MDSYNNTPDSIVGQAANSMNSNQPLLSQVSTSSPTFDPNAQNPPEMPMPEKSPMAGMGEALKRALMRRSPTPAAVSPSNQGVGANQPATPQPAQAPQQPESDKIIDFLSELGSTFSKRLDTIGKHETAVRDALLPKNLGVGNNSPEI